eukprot:TRINITY_DN6889_c0_g1_i1.p1 TRINITY_DN6889_c0_g1~~TRINITY_DN6889_c0_g1_i1.p1  ORF type:complete len:111 (-),score=33.55 TRINITY_DN6889_c0_g1_i1:232-564(-)
MWQKYLYSFIVRTLSENKHFHRFVKKTNSVVKQSMEELQRGETFRKVSQTFNEVKKAAFDEGGASASSGPKKSIESSRSSTSTSSSTTSSTQEESMKKLGEILERMKRKD